MNWIYSIVPIQSAFHPNEWIKMAQELKWTQENCHDIRIQMRRGEKGNVDEIEIKLSQKKISILIDFKQQIKLQVFYFRPNQNRVNEILFGMKRKADESYDLSEKISIGSSQFHWLWFHSPINNAIAFMSQHSSEKMKGMSKKWTWNFLNLPCNTLVIMKIILNAFCAYWKIVMLLPSQTIHPNKWIYLYLTIWLLYHGWCGFFTNSRCWRAEKMGKNI